MLLHRALLIAAGLALAMLLHGCGGGGGSTTTTTTSTFTTTTTPLVVPNRSRPMSSYEAATLLNKLYLGFNESDPKSPLGVTLSMAAKDESFFENQYCSVVGIPGLNLGSGCYNGQADCRMSTSVISHMWMIDNTTRAVSSFGHRDVGYVFNQTMVETKWGKCSFIWDGASGNRYNRGCGDGAPTSSCKDGSGSAWFNTCPSTGKTCTADDAEVQRAICNVAGGTRPVPPTHDGETECIFPGPAFNYHGQSGYKAGKDYTRTMAMQRINFNHGKDNTSLNIAKNNEVVLDEELLIPDYWVDPIAAIPAFVYAKSNLPISKVNAQKVRDDFCKYTYCEQNGGGKIPLVEINDMTYQSWGPFTADSEEDTTLAV